MTTDPRTIPGSMSGPGGPHKRGGVVFDAEHVVLMRSVDVAIIEAIDDAPTLLAMVLGGRINFTQEMAQVMFVFGADGAAALVTELVAVIGRMPDGDLKAEFMEDLDRRFEQLKANGNLSPRDDGDD